MRSKITNKVQLNVMVALDTKTQLAECAENLGIKPNEAMEIAIARLHADQKSPSLTAKNSIKQLSQDVNELRKTIQELAVKFDSIHDES